MWNNIYFPKYAGQKKCGITVESLLETFSARFWPCILKGKLIFTAPTAFPTAEGRFGLLKTREAATWIIPTLHYFMCLTISTLSFMKSAWYSG